MERRLRESLPNRGFGVVDPKRSHTMSAIRGRGNKTTEQRLRLALVRYGIKGWVMHSRTLPGRPDFLFIRPRIAVFVDGCFWHGCPQCGHLPKTNADFWQLKIERNRQRDCAATFALRRQGYIVLRFWEHELREDLRRCVNRIRNALHHRERNPNAR